MYYQAIVAFETGALDGNGNPKVKKFKYIVEAESVYEATTRVSRYLSEDTRDSEIVSLVKATVLKGIFLSSLFFSSMTKGISLFLRIMPRRQPIIPAPTITIGFDIMNSLNFRCHLFQQAP